MPFFLSPVGNDQQCDANGNPLVGGTITTYQAGSSTPSATYTDSTGSTPQANPITLNSLGLSASPIWLTGGQTYKLVVKDSGGVTIRTIDNVSGINDTATSVSEWLALGITPTYVSATSFTVPGDQTSTLQIGRRLKTTNTSGSIYSTITNAVYTTLTTITVRNDSSVLDAGLSAVFYGLISFNNSSWPQLATQNYNATTTGASPTYVASMSPSVTSLVAGKTRVNLTFNVSNGGPTATTLNVDGTGVLGLKQYDSAGAKSDPIIIAGMSGDVLYDGTHWVILDPLPSSANIQIQPLPTPTLAAGAMTIPSASYTLDFRNATLGTGGRTQVTGSPSALVIPSGATLGTTSGVQSDIYVLALNNAGTIEYAVVNAAGGVDISETGVISTTAISAAATSATTVYSTTARTNVAYRVIGVIRSTQATAGTWATAPSLVQGAGGQFKIPVSSMVRLNTANGYGSTNTKIRRFANFALSLGSDITYTDSATLGASFTVNTSGVYSISYTDNFGGVTWLGISLNTANPTTNISTLTVSEVVKAVTVAGANLPNEVSCTLYLAAGSVIRAHTDGAAVGGAGANGCMFTMTRVA